MCNVSEGENIKQSCYCRYQHHILTRFQILYCENYFVCLTEYDRYLASSKIMAAAYLDPNLNHTPNSSTKTHLGASVERSPGAMERVLKVFHYFESNSEPATWASIIRHGDATDVRVSLLP